jgi:hypothetical protein
MQTGFFAPASGRIQIETYAPAQTWVTRGVITVTFQAGDVFGARANTDGTVEVYRNGNLIGTGNVSAWTYNANGGRIGLWVIGATTLTLDDFGGGTVP